MSAISIILQTVVKGMVSKPESQRSNLGLLCCFDPKQVSSSAKWDNDSTNLRGRAHKNKMEVNKEIGNVNDI